jgi:hypothetical protein
MDARIEPAAVRVTAGDLDAVAAAVAGQLGAPRLDGGDVGHPGVAAAALGFETAWRHEAEELSEDLAVLAAYLRAAAEAFADVDEGSIISVEVGG